MILMREAGEWTRRAWIRSAACGVIGWQSASWLSALAHAMAAPVKPKRRCILLWMTGGPSQIDTFDMKPGHENGGSFKEIATAVPGIRICEHLPQTAAMAGELAIIRSMTSKEGDHERATLFVQTGYRPAGGLKYPTFGAATGKQLQPDEGDLPRYVVIQPGFFSRQLGAGYLGARHAPLAVNSDGSATGELRVRNLRRPPTIMPARFERRKAILEQIEQQRSAEDEFLASAHRSAYTQAIRMMEGPAQRVFDLSHESPSQRDAYGRNPFGQGCLLARRLVERGVPFVEVALNGIPNQQFVGWDTHANNFQDLPLLCAALDAAMATLLRDLKARGLLEETLIVWMGEFGRTPRINGTQGRDHFPDAWSVVLAGGGIRGGQVLGQTSADGMEVIDRPVQIPDLLATVCEALGVDRHQQNMSNLGRPIRVVDPAGQPISELLG